MTISVTKPEVPEKPQDSEVVLSVQGVSKKFCRDLKRSLFYGVQDIASELLGIREKNDKLRKKEFWALQNVSFELRRGEALGLVGPNGSGKTTLMRIIAGLIRPDTGSVEVKGRVAPLIALGAGFNPILTGRENIYANMSILGLSKQEIDERFDAVVEFAEIGDAIDAPVQSYSSGMAARLGFASAIHTEPDILLIDEVFAVGDISFREKCRRRLYELRKKETCLILVSHNPHVVLETCEISAYLAQGVLITSGDANSVMIQYEEDQFLNKKSKEQEIINLPDGSEDKNTGLNIISLYFRNSHGKIVESPISGESIYFCVKCKVQKEILNAGLHLSIGALGREGGTVLVLNSFQDGVSLDMSPGEREIQIKMPYLGLRLGLYKMSVYVRKDSIYTLDCCNNFTFKVKANESTGSNLFYQPRSWGIAD